MCEAYVKLTGLLHRIFIRLMRIIRLFNFVKRVIVHIPPLIPNESRLYGLLIVLLHFGNTTVQRHPNYRPDNYREASVLQGSPRNDVAPVTF
jgi:hypothetical protein